MLDKSDEYWRQKLTPQQYAVLREKATDIPFQNIYHDKKDKGIYRCAGCEEMLFSSDQKYDSGCGWPSFYDLAKTGVVKLQDDLSHGMHRTEVVCSNCGGHLGHLFNDGPSPTGLRYCINSSALNFEEK